jgi:hypothetical protein
MQNLVCALTLVLLLVAAVPIGGLRRPLRAMAAAVEATRQMLAQNSGRLNLAMDGAGEAWSDWDVSRNWTYYSERWAQMQARL